MNRQLGTFIVWAAAFWAVIFVPARYMWGPTAIAYSLTALGLCLVPALLILTLAKHHPTVSPEATVMIVFGGTGLRILFVMGGGLVLYSVAPYFQQVSFWIWILVFYLYTLVLEVVLLRGKQAGLGGR
jgi:hypothetical protein